MLNSVKNKQAIIIDFGLREFLFSTQATKQTDKKNLKKTQQHKNNIIR